MVATSGTTSASMKYITVSDGEGESFQKSHLSMRNNTRFKGTLSAVKELNRLYDGNLFCSYGH